MRPYYVHSRGPDLSDRRLLRSSLFGIVLGLAFLFTLNLASAQTYVEPRCGATEDPHCGSPSAVAPGEGAAAGNYRITGPSAPAPGPLVYDDFKRIEDRARFLLKRNLGFREDISPYQGANNFNKLVRQFDTNSGFNAEYDDPDPAIGKMSLAQRVQQADDELAEARDLYAYLAVFASPARFRSDDGSSDDIAGNDYKNVLCKDAEKENPPQNPPGPLPPDPIIDWCNFPARLRQSVREASNLRMIFAQQFVVDALGLNSSAELLGGEEFVRKELGKLQLAVHQYDEGETKLAEALGRVVGNGCYVSDFFEQREWALLSAMAEKKELAQHHIAVRQSYMGIKTDTDLVRQQALATDVYRAAAMEGYIKMAGMAGRAALPPGSGCASTPPQNALVAEMAASMLETRARAREMSEGRNVFGYDITFTPTRPYSTDADSCGATDLGLWLEAKCLADNAARIEDQVESAGRAYDENQQKLIEQINLLNTGLNEDIGDISGCSLAGNDDAFFACAAEQVRLVSECIPTDDAGFDACMSRPQVMNSKLKQARRNVRSAWLALQQAKTIHDNFTARMNTEEMRNSKVTSEMLTASQERSAFEAAIAAANCCTIGVGPVPEYEVNPGAFIEAGLRVGQILVQNAHDMEIEDINKDAVIRNLFLDQAEARYDIDMAFQQYATAADAFDTIAGTLEANVSEARRQRSYLVASPANDPSYRMVRDSLRLDLAHALEEASRTSYLAARRAEYEYTARLSRNNFRISDIYKARTANNIIKFLNDLRGAIASLPAGNRTIDIDDEDFTISVSRHLLGLTDSYLQAQGFSGPGIEAERRLRFRDWVRTHTRVDGSGAEIIAFDFVTSSDTKGILNNVKQQGYDYYWLHKMAGIAQPLPGNTGTGINLRTDQSNLAPAQRQARLVQNGQVELTSFAGCLFSYRLVPDAVMKGLDWPQNQPTDTVTGNLQAGVNGANSDPTRRFNGRPVAGSWQVVIYTGPQPKLDVDLLNDIELKFSTTFANRESNAPPLPQDCVRADF